MPEELLPFDPMYRLFRPMIAACGIAAAVSPHVTAGDSVLASRLFELTQTFDSALRTKKSQTDLDLLCRQYLDRLGKIRDATPPPSSFITTTIGREIERVEDVKKGYLLDAPRFARIRLSPNWQDCITHKEAAQDFRTVLGVTPGTVDPEKRPELEADFQKAANILPGQPFLVPLEKFVASFSEVDGFKVVKARILVGMPGMPAKSFYYHSFDGDFSSHAGPFGTFNRMYVVTDEWDQVVAVQFTSESPKGVESIRTTGIGIFNFVQFRRKGSSSAWVKFKTDLQSGTTRIATLMGDGSGLKEVNVLYLPSPVRSLIEHALGGG